MKFDINLRFTAAKLMRNYLQCTHMWSFQFGYWFQFAETFSFLVGSWNLAILYINILHQMHPLKDHVILHDDGRGKLKTLIWSRKFSFTKIKSPLWRLQSTIHPGQQWGIYQACPACQHKQSNTHTYILATCTSCTSWLHNDPPQFCVHLQLWRIA